MIPMIFKARILDLETGTSVVLMNETDGDTMNIHPGDRVILRISAKSTVAIVNITGIIEHGTIGLTKDVNDELRARTGEAVEVVHAPQPKSITAIKDKLNGRRLDYDDIYEIVKDAVNKKLDKNELTAFVVALNAFGLDIEEAEYMSVAMVKTGEQLGLKKKRIFDKHSIGGVPGDKTTLLVVPIIAAAGLTIPKTSSRAITSATGTADRAEALMPVDLSAEEMRKVVEKTNGCIVWGGAVHMAPADDIFIKIEYPFSIDPLLLPSILSKKKAAGSTDLVLDIPTGQNAKIKNKEEAWALTKDFVTLGERMGINIRGAVTYGEQPIGYAIGAAAEAREALQTLHYRNTVPDLIDKATSIAGILLEMGGKENGKKLAKNIIDKGLAEQKLRQIISEQGGDPKVKAEDMQIGRYSADIESEFDGRVLSIDNTVLAYSTRLAGAPKMKSAAIIMHKKLGDSVKKGDKLLTIYSDSTSGLKDAERYVIENAGIVAASGSSMLLKEIHIEKMPQRGFVLER